MKWLERVGRTVALALLSSTGALARDVTFFEGGINYWDEPVKPKAAVTETRKEPVEKAPKRPAFDWKTVMDPRNDDFFREGDYVPPAPFMEVAREPSDENIRMWHAYIARKNALAARLEQRLKEYSATHSGMAVSEGATSAPPVASEPELKALDANARVDPLRFRLRLYFDSECPHCRRMMGTLADLKARGFAVEALQVDERPLPGKGLPFPVARASPEEVNRLGIASVPFLLVGDLEAKVVYKMTGYKTASEIFRDIRSGEMRTKK